MARPQIRRAAAAFALTSVLSWIPCQPANAAARPHPARQARAERSAASRVEPQGSWLRGLFTHLWEKARVMIDPEGIASRPDLDGHG